jgi:hypothetical protein
VRKPSGFWAALLAFLCFASVAPPNSNQVSKNVVRDITATKSLNRGELVVRNQVVIGFLQLLRQRVASLLVLFAAILFIA